MLNTCVVTVTYGDRYERLTLTTINRALAAGASRVVLIDNGSDSAGCALMDRDFGNDPRITIFHSETNLGSAAGFAKGIAIAAEMENRFILLLDDDNWIESDTLERLISTQERAAIHYGDPQTAVSGFRDLDSDHVRIAEGRTASIVFPPIGSFLSFDVYHYIRRHLPVSKKELTIDDLCLPNAPYGGLLFATKLLDSVGLPPAGYVLYVDDTVWTSRIVAAGHRIVLDRFAHVHDADSKWSRTQGGGPRGLLASSDERKLYFSVRNRVHFELSQIYSPQQRIRYKINKAVYLAIAKADVFRKRGKNLAVFKLALKDGRKFVLAD